MTTRLYHFSLVLIVLVMLFAGGCGGSVGVEVASSSPAADAKADDHAAAATMAAAEATAAAAQATKAAAVQVIVQATQMAQGVAVATRAEEESPSPAVAAGFGDTPTATPSADSPGTWTVRGTGLFGESYEQELPVGQGPLGPVPMAPGMEMLPFVAQAVASMPTAEPTPAPVAPDLDEAVQITYGDVITREIKPSGEVDVFTFTGRASEVAHVAAAGTDDAPWMSLRVEVFDPEGAPVEGGGRGEYDLTVGGRHSFTVQDADTQTGSYVLSLKNVSPGAGESVHYGDVVEGEIGIAGEKDVYTFEAKAGDVARIAMSERKETHARKANLVVTLLDPHGETLGYDDIWVGNIGLIGHAVDTDGLYTIEIRVTGQLDSPRTSEYTLLLKDVAHSTGSPLTYGNLLEGEIEPPGDRDIYTFERRPGEEIVIEATGEGPPFDFQLQVEIFDPQGRSVALVGSAGRIKPLLSDEGTYTLVVQDESGHAGSLSTGSYSLLLLDLAAEFLQDALTIDTDNERVYCLAWSPGGSRLASCGNSDAVTVWDSRNGGQVRELQGQYIALSASWSPDGTRLASGSEDGTVRVWDARSGAEMLALDADAKGSPSLAWSPDGTQLASGSQHVVRVWDAVSGHQLRMLKGHTDTVTSVAWSPDGAQIASGSIDGSVRLWEPDSGAELRALSSGADKVGVVAWSPDGRWLASAGSEDGTIQIWDVARGQEAWMLEGHTQAVRSVVWSPDGERLASGGEDGTVRVWAVATHNQLCVLFDYEDDHMYGFPVSEVAWSPVGDRLAWGGSNDDKVRVWSVAAGCHRWYRP